MASEVQIRRMARTPDGKADPQSFGHRAKRMAGGVKQLRSATLLVHRTERALLGYLIATGRHDEVDKTALDLAHAVGAKATVVEDVDDVLNDVDVSQPVGWLVARRNAEPVRASVLGADPKETAKALWDAMSPGSWLALTLREPARGERDRYLEWRKVQMGVSTDSGALVHADSDQGLMLVSIAASAPTVHATRSLLGRMETILPGFEMKTRSRIATPSRLAAPFVAAAATVMALWALVTTGLTSGVTGRVVEALPVDEFFLGLVGLLVLVGGTRSLRLAPSKMKRMRRGVESLRFPRPPRVLRPRQAPRDSKVSDGKVVKRRRGEYPLVRSVFAMAPHQVVGVVTPVAASGETSTVSDSVPPVVLDRIGPAFGNTHRGPAHLSAADAFGGVAIIGRSGSGKSELLYSLYAHSCLERVRPSGLPGFPGRRNSIIAFETKGGGIEKYAAWANAMGDQISAIEFADDDTYAIDMFHIPGESALRRAEMFVKAMETAWGTNEIGSLARPMLQMAFTVALALTTEIKQRVPGLALEESPVYYAHVILGGYGEALGEALAQEVIGAAAASTAATGFRGVRHSPDVEDAARLLLPVYQGLTPAKRRSDLDTSRRKTSELLSVPGWWRRASVAASEQDAPLLRLTFDDVIENHWPVVINTGVSRSGVQVDEGLDQKISSMLMYLLRRTIQRQCVEWEAQHRFISIYADELAMLAGTSPDTIEWLKTKGRSFGVRMVMATQYPEQLGDVVFTSFLNFSTLITFGQDSATTARRIAAEIDAGSGEWTEQHIIYLDNYTTIVRSMVGGRRQEPYVAQIPNWASDRAGFAEAQGYPPGTAAHPIDPPYEPRHETGAPVAPVEFTKQAETDPSTYQHSVDAPAIEAAVVEAHAQPQAPASREADPFSDPFAGLDVLTAAPQELPAVADPSPTHEPVPGWPDTPAPAPHAHREPVDADPFSAVDLDSLYRED